ncbi:MAG TPA: hypothetical protein VH062_37560 [Polyangiaceae bacterium]|jgi:hypothetical protein|nr:hypothetical protein [Polyangiaceae bacterium]
MKPGDHPDFFRLPPPPGRSRESRIVLDELGRFWNGPVPIDHEAMATAFASWITIHPDDGRFIMTNGYDWTYFTVKDAPFLVRHVETTGRGTVLRLFDGSEESLDPSSVTVSEDGILYTRVKDGRFEARLAPAAQKEMVDVLDEGPDGAAVVRIGERDYPVRARGASIAAAQT